MVNVLGGVLRYYLGADLPPAPDDMYLSVNHAPYDFKRVDLAWLARPGAPGAASTPPAWRPPPRHDRAARRPVLGGSAAAVACRRARSGGC